MVIQDFDSVFVHIGGFGRYQMLLFSVNCFMCALVSFVYFGQFFMTLTPPHWCAPPPDLAGLNLTSDQVKSLTIPRDPHTGKYLECVRYQVDFKEVIENQTSWPDPSWPTISCSHGWAYDFSLFYPTITSQLDWVCAEDWKPTLAQSLFFVGSLVGSPVLGWAADAWGRLPVIVATNVVGGLAGVASAFCASFASFTVFRFVVGITFDSHYNAVYILIMEYVSSEYRSIMGNVPILIFLTASMCAMPWLAWASADWAVFAVVIHAPQVLCVAFYWLLPESARWLLGQGRVKDTLRILKTAARINGKSLSPATLQELQDFGLRKAEEKRPKVNVLDLFKTPVLRRRFLLLCLMSRPHSHPGASNGRPVPHHHVRQRWIAVQSGSLAHRCQGAGHGFHPHYWLRCGFPVALRRLFVQVRPLPPVHHPGRGDHRGRPRVRPPAGDAGPEAAGQPGEDGEAFFAGQSCCCYNPCARYRTQVSTSDDQTARSDDPAEMPLRVYHTPD
ncbi:beta-alanine transporter-like isoform X2 [Penaeus vannamei]|uniref:beta-alanine transporter-like isoform X2 n=1 Tax=Penaeus vannamei TaxID=6689 RepID=UPI00387F9806